MINGERIQIKIWKIYWGIALDEEDSENLSEIL